MVTDTDFDKVEQLITRERLKVVEAMAELDDLASDHLARLVYLQRGLVALREAKQDEASSGPSVYENDEPYV